MHLRCRHVSPPNAHYFAFKIKLAPASQGIGQPTTETYRPRKLTAHQRQEALRRLSKGETQAEVARTYAVDPTTIGRL
jgi:hypothetical protein